MSEPTATTNSDGQAGFRFAPGTRLAGRYVVERGLGRGGMGEVYQVQDTRLGESVALKALSERLVSSAVALSRFEAEVRNARRVAHPGVCRTYDFGTHGEGEAAVHFLTMELLAGETLEARLERGKLGSGEALDVLGQVAAAIDAAHEAGVVHRDLKPSNILLVARSGGGTRAVITDFGLARQVEQSRITTQEGWVGTPAYIAPEQLQGDAGGPASDVYSFGVVVYQAVTGRLPFEGSTGPQVALQRLARPAPRARTVDPSVPAAWDEAIARCLEQDPARRFAHASDAVRAMAGQPPSGWSSSAMPVARGGGRGGRAAAMVLAAAAIAVAATTAVMVRQRSRAPALPATGRMLAVMVRPASGVKAPELPPELPPFDEAAAYVVREELRMLEEPRRFRVSADAQGNVQVLLEWAPHGSGVRAGVVLQATGGAPVTRFEADAPSIRELAIALHPKIADVVGAGQPAVELFPEERAEMVRWAAPDAQAYKDLRRIIFDIYRTNLIDAEDVNRRLDDLIRRHPGWPHAVLARLSQMSLSSPSARALAASQLPLVPAGLDKDVRELLLQVAQGGVVGGQAMIDRWSRLGDLVVDCSVSRSATGILTEEELRAAMVQLADRYPDLQWTGVVPVIVNGRPDWHARAPGNAQAWLTMLAGLALGTGPSPRPYLGWFRLLYGSLAGTATMIAGIHLARFELDDVHALVPAILARPQLERAVGLVLLADEQVFRGRLRVAIDDYLRAREIASSGGPDINFFWTQADRSLVQLDVRSGDASAAREHRRLLLRDWETYDWPQALLGAFRWEAAYAATGTCPPLKVPDRAGLTEADRREGLRLLRRAAVAAGCGRCDSVLLDGASVNEGMLPWTDVFARCAVEEGRGLDEALRRLSTAERYRPLLITQAPDPSPVDVVLAHYWMGRVLEKQGKPAEAKAKYERFLQFWGQADIPIPEVDEAKKRLAALGAGAK